MLANTSFCRLLCASASAYYVDLNGHFIVPSSSDKDYKEYQNVGFLHTPTPFSNFTTTPIDKKINAAILGETSMGYILAFRGTLPPKTWTPATIEDWWQDICKSGEVSDPILPGKVHQGFHTAFMTLWPQIKPFLDHIYITNKSTKKLYITGHSKGGPMASYAAYYAKHYGYPLANISTFASPYAGNSAWAKGYNAVIQQDRYENFLDIVPWLPPNQSTLGTIVPEIDAFITLLENTIGFKTELDKLKNFINQSLKLDYTAVGQLYFIQQNHSITTPQQTHDLTKKRLSQFTALFVKDFWHPTLALQTIGDAHSIGCGGGYESGVCGIC